jgi:cytochrome P450
MNRFDPWDTRHRADPQPLYEQMRAQGPAVCLTGPMTGNNVWFIVDHDAATTILKHPDTVKSIDNLPPAVRERYTADMSGPARLMMQNMLFMDPPDHTRLRGLVHKAFTPKRIEDLRLSTRRIAENTLAALDPNATTFDLIESFALPLPITVIADLLGVPPPDREQFRAWVHVLLNSGYMREIERAALEFMMYFHELFDQRKADPQDDLLSAVLQVEDNGDTLSREELMSMVFLLLTAGHETTVNLIGNGMLALMQHPEQYDLLQQDPSLVPLAVEELLRFNGPVEVASQRWASADIQLGDLHMKPGDFLGVALVAANRDPAIFAEPNALDITRTPNKHIAFGAGIHYCLGAPLARLEGIIAFEMLMSHFNRLELAVPVDALEWNHSMLLHGMKALPVRRT